MRRIGLTGNIGSGKSTVAALLRARGFTVLDADAVAHEVSSSPEVLSEVAQAFGPPYVLEHGLNRAHLAELVFRDPGARARLNAIVHPRVRARMRQLERDAGAETVFQDIPLLFESGLEHSFDTVVLVDAPLSVRLERALARGGLTREQVLARDAAQMPPEEKRRRATFTLENGGDLAALEGQVEGLLGRLGLPRTL